MATPPGESRSGVAAWFLGYKPPGYAGDCAGSVGGSAMIEREVVRVS